MPKFAATILLAPLVFGCSSDGGGDADPAVKQEEVEIEVFSWWVQPGEAEALSALFERHTATHPNERIFNAPEASGPTAKQVLSDRLDAKKPPDLFQQNAYEMRNLLAAHPGAIEQLDEQFSEDELAAIAPEIMDSVSVDGHIYSVPVNAHRENSLFYNAKLFEAHDLQPPKTLDDFLTACETLKTAGVTPVALSTSQGWIVSKLFLSLASASMGAQQFHDYFSGKSELDEAVLGDAIDVLDTVLTNYINVDQAATDGFGWTQSAEAVFNEEAAMFLHGDWAKSYLESLGWTPNVEFGVVGSPGSSELFVYGTDVFSVPAGAKNAEAARHFVDTVTSKEGQIAFNKLKGSTPIRFDIPTEKFDAMAQEVIADFKNADIRMALNWQGAWDTALGEFAADHDREKLIQVFKDNPPS